MRKYRGGNERAYDLKAAGEHIIWYHQMVDLMAEKFPDVTRVINYEDMVADPAAALVWRQNYVAFRCLADRHQ
jgi:hypothetical protein